MEITMKRRNLARATVLGAMTLALAATLGAQAQTPGQDESRQRKRLENRLERKLAEPWLTKNPWRTSLREAKAVAKRENKPIFAYLTRSYTPCAWCVRCEKGPLVEDAFVTFAKDVVLYAWIDSRLPTMEVPRLMRGVGGKGYPAIAFLDPDGRLLYLQNGLEERSVREFEQTRKQVAAILDARTRERADEKGARLDRVLAELRLSNSNPELAKSRIAEAGTPTEAQRRRIDALLVDLRIRYLVRRNKRRPQRLGRALREMLDAEQLPEGRRVKRIFWRELGRYAKRIGDTKLESRVAAAVSEQSSK